MTNILLISLIISIIILIVLVCLRVLPVWTLYVYILGTMFCFITWEVWMSLGIVDGDSYRDRGGTGSSNIVNAITMSLGDGFLILGIVGICIGLFGKSAFNSWNWKVFAVFFLIGFTQNIIIALIITNRIHGKDLSLAPFMPIKTESIIQQQEPWILTPIFFYLLFINTKIIPKS